MTTIYTIYNELCRLIISTSVKYVQVSANDTGKIDPQTTIDDDEEELDDEADNDDGDEEIDPDEPFPIPPEYVSAHINDTIEASPVTEVSIVILKLLYLQLVTPQAKRISYLLSSVLASKCGNCAIQFEK